MTEMLPPHLLAKNRRSYRIDDLLRELTKEYNSAFIKEMERRTAEGSKQQLEEDSQVMFFNEGPRYKDDFGVDNPRDFQEEPGLSPFSSSSSNYSGLPSPV